MKSSSITRDLIFINIILLMLCTSSKANHEETNGCGSDPYAQFIPEGITANFHNACNNHDLCYGKLGKTKAQCDDEFHDEMREKCDSTYSELWEVLSKEACYGAAYGYYDLVVRMGGDAYRDAQAHAREEENSEISIENKISEASPNSTIWLPAGVYPEVFTITKPIRIESEGGTTHIGIR